MRPVWTPGLTTITLQPQEPTPHLGTLSRGPGALGNWICQRNWVEGVGGGHCDFSLQFPAHQPLAPFFFLSPKETSFLKLPKEQTRTSLSCALKPLGTSLMPSCREAEQTSLRPYPRAQAGGLRNVPRMAPSPLWSSVSTAVK